MTHDEIYERVRQQVDAKHETLFGRCFWWSFYGFKELLQEGNPVCLQAGTAYWPRIDHPETDDAGLFGFMWDPDSAASRFWSGLGALPESHVWLGVASTQELIDFSTGDWPTLCKRLIGNDWPGPQPPKYYWGPASEVPNNVYYEPIRDATIAMAKRVEGILSLSSLEIPETKNGRRSTSPA